MTRSLTRHIIAKQSQQQWWQIAEPPDMILLPYRLTRKEGLPWCSDLLGPPSLLVNERYLANNVPEASGYSCCDGVCSTACEVARMCWQVVNQHTFQASTISRGHWPDAEMRFLMFACTRMIVAVCGPPGSIRGSVP